MMIRFTGFLPKGSFEAVSSLIDADQYRRLCSSAAGEDRQYYPKVSPRSRKFMSQKGLFTGTNKPRRSVLPWLEH